MPFVLCGEGEDQSDYGCKDFYNSMGMADSSWCGRCGHVVNKFKLIVTRRNDRKKKLLYIYNIYIIYIIKFYFTIFLPLFCFTDHVTTLTTPLTKKPVFSVVSSWWTRALDGWCSPVRVVLYEKLFPLWRQHPREDGGRWAFGAVAGFVPICRWRRTGKTSKCIQCVYKNYRNYGKV